MKEITHVFKVGDWIDCSELSTDQVKAIIAKSVNDGVELNEDERDCRGWCRKFVVRHLGGTCFSSGNYIDEMERNHGIKPNELTWECITKPIEPETPWFPKLDEVCFVSLVGEDNWVKGCVTGALLGKVSFESEHGLNVLDDYKIKFKPINSVDFTPVDGCADSYVSEEQAKEFYESSRDNSELKGIDKAYKLIDKSVSFVDDKPYKPKVGEVCEFNTGLGIPYQKCLTVRFHPVTGNPLIDIGDRAKGETIIIEATPDHWNLRPIQSEPKLIDVDTIPVSELSGNLKSIAQLIDSQSTRKPYTPKAGEIFKVDMGDYLAKALYIGIDYKDRHTYQFVEGDIEGKVYYDKNTDLFYPIQSEREKLGLKLYKTINYNSCETDEWIISSNRLKDYIKAIDAGWRPTKTTCSVTDIAENTDYDTFEPFDFTEIGKTND